MTRVSLVLVWAVFALGGDASAAAADPHFSSPSYAISERAGSVQIAVERTANTEAPVTVSYRASARTDPYRAATAGADFLPAAGKIVFEPGDTLKSFLITILDDSLAQSLGSCLEWLRSILPEALL